MPLSPNQRRVGYPPAPASIAERAARAIAPLARAARELAQHFAATPPAPTQILVRELNVSHLGRWVVIPGTPDSARTRNEPSLLANGGRLVGFTPAADTARAPSERVLILLRGTTTAVPARADAHVVVAPREWS